MYDSVDGGRGGHRVLEDAVPLREDEVAADEHAPTLVPLGKEGEEDLHLGTVLLDVAEVVQDDRIEAVRIAWLADGVTEVLTEIQVTDRGGLVDYAHDTWITTQLRSKLLLDKDVRAINFNVETVNGVVYLIGIAQDQAELERVTNHARTITNVVKVVSHARLKDDPVN